MLIEIDSDNEVSCFELTTGFRLKVVSQKGNTRTPLRIAEVDLTVEQATTLANYLLIHESKSK